MSYKEALALAMQDLAKDPKVRFVGYGVRVGGKAAGSLKGIPDEQLLEMPVAESLMVGFAIGLSLKGLKPVVYIERADFLLNALDAIVNHLDKISLLSKVEFTPAVILRVVVGNKSKALFTGATHTQDFTEAVSKMVNFPVRALTKATEVATAYRAALAALSPAELNYPGVRHKSDPYSTMLVEYKDLI